MAIDNKNKNTVDACTDDDTTSELAIIEANSPRPDIEYEADASTYAFDDDSPDGQSVDSLRSDLRSRNERIGKLQFDAEQLRARWTGLEKEIETREELTKILQQDLREAHKERSTRNKLVRRQEREIESLNSRITELEQGNVPEPSRAGAEIAEAKFERTNTEGDSADSLREQLERARLTVSELKTYIDGRQNDWVRLHEEIEGFKVSLSGKDATVTKLESELLVSEKTIENEAARIERLQSKFEKEQARCRKLREKNRALIQDIDDYQNNAQFNVEHRLAEQSGRLVSNNDELTDLKNQIARSEQYADGLRDSLRTLDIASTQTDTERQQLAASLRQATDQLRELQEQLDAERLLKADLESAMTDIKKDFEKEAKLIRFELGAAQQTIGDYESVNEELASDLIDNTHYRLALETQLSDADEKHKATTSRLEKQGRRLEKQLEDREHKIATKDAAISALLSELASKSQAMESIGDIGNVIHEIDGKMSERIDERGSQDRDRPTRLLTGRIGGQELQFPLFKERLTIGRTQQNDIQLNAQYISRRHAVVISDESGSRIIDWGSKNGVAVNGVRVSEQRLRSGDKVAIGTAEFVFEERPKR
ncbi:MAG: FHA domain-containing protein [Gammaproteobacteria bacterium]|nr:FHA domain-containing protein [Gammaproteobacteria bacterium]